MEICTVKDLALILKIKEATIYTWVYQKRIPYIKLNGKLCFDYNQIKAWVDNNRFDIN